MQIVDKLCHENAMVSVMIDRITKRDEEKAGAVMGLTDGCGGGAANDETLPQKLYVSSEADGVVHLPGSSSHLDSVKSIKDEVELITGGRVASQAGEEGSKSRSKGGNNSTGNNGHPAVPVTPDETTGLASNKNSISSPSPLGGSCSSPGDGSFLDPNAPEFTPSSFYPPRMFSPPVDFYNNPSLLPGAELPPPPPLPPLVYGTPVSDLSSQLAPSPRPCYGELPLLGCPVSSPQSYGRPLARAQEPTDYSGRALLLTEVHKELKDDELRKDLSAWGEIRSLDLGKLCEGSVTVHYYDIRHAGEAFKDMTYHKQQSPLQILNGGESRNSDDDSRRGLIGGKPVCVQYSFTDCGDSASDYKNQGTLVVYDLDTDVSFEDLRAKFEKYGDVKDIRGAASKVQQKFVEFYDTRDAARALEALHGQQLFGNARRVRIEFSRKFFGRKGRPASLQNGRRGYNHTPASAPGPMHWHSPEPQGLPSPLGVGVGVSVSPHHLYGHMASLQINGEMHNPQQQAAVLSWYGGCNGQLQPPSPSPALPYYMPMSPNGNGFLPATPNGSPRIASNGGMAPNRLSVDVSPIHDGFDNGLGGGSGLVHNFNGRTGLTPRSSPRDLGAHYVFDEKAAELNQGIPRTTLMVRNIPNKYSQPELIKLLDEHCLQQNSQIGDSNEVESAFDFVYLPIDFKNRCNLGYGFVNFTSVQGAVRFYKARHMQMWERFNSSKICEISYARLQGRVALEVHFRNSVFPCNTDKYLPVTFSPSRNGIRCTPPTVAAGHLAGRRSNSSPPPTPTNIILDSNTSDNNNNSGGGNCKNAVPNISMTDDNDVSTNQTSETSQR